MNSHTDDNMSILLTLGDNHDNVLGMRSQLGHKGTFNKNEHRFWCSGYNIGLIIPSSVVQTHSRKTTV